MRGLVKKSIVVFVSMLFLTSVAIVSCAINVQKTEVEVLEETLVKSTRLVKRVTLYRCGIDGAITPIQVDINLEEGEDMEEAIADKCNELLDGDMEIQSFIKRNRSGGGFMLSKIRSRGRGFHFKIKIRVQLIKRIKLFPLLPPYFRTRIFIPTIYCKYSKDVKAHTTITPLIGGAGTRVIDGPHRILAVGFIGYKGWLGHISYLGFGIRTGFAGYTLLGSCKKL